MASRFLYRPLPSLNYRFNLYFGVLDRIVVGQHVSNIKELDNLKKYIGYLENVMDASGRRFVMLTERYVDPTWRSNAFDLWLVKETLFEGTTRDGRRISKKFE